MQKGQTGPIIIRKNRITYKDTYKPMNYYECSSKSALLQHKRIKTCYDEDLCAILNMLKDFTDLLIWV